VGNTARFSEAKNHSVIIQGALRVCAAVPKAKFLLVGDGPLRGPSETLVANSDVRDRIVFAGWRDDIPAQLSAMDIFFFPSLWEGFGISLIEAQAGGLPCVTSDLPCFQEVLHPALWQLRVPATDVDAAVDRLISLLRDAPGRRELGAKAREHAQQFDSRRIVRRIEQLYLDGLAAAGRRVR
jgi:glycosyltransferase involved in cell wall biosynthesis